MYEFLQRTSPSDSQDFGVTGRIAWAIYCCNAGKTAMSEGDRAKAITILREGILAFPFPRSLELLGECLLLEGRPVEATVYLAAAIGLNDEYQFDQLFLLAKALFAANDNFVSKIMLRKAISIKPDQEAEDLLNVVISRSSATST